MRGVSFNPSTAVIDQGDQKNSASRAAVTPNRYISIDVLRAIAVILMIQDHITTHLAAVAKFIPHTHSVLADLGDIPAPLFTFLSGLSYWLWLSGQERAGRSASDITKYSLRRGMFIFVAGMMVNVFIWLPSQTFIWDILTLIGASALVLTGIRNFRPSTLVAICVLIIILSPPLRHLAHYRSSWSDPDFSGDPEYQYKLTLTQLIRGFFLNGYFPLFPWLVFLVAGYAFGKVFYGHGQQKARLPIGVVHVGLLLTGLSVFGYLLGANKVSFLPHGYAVEWTYAFYPAATIFVVGALGLTLLSLWLLNRLLDSRPWVNISHVFLAPFRRYSYFSLTTYIVHIAASIWPMWILATWRGERDSTEYYGVMTSLQTSLILGWSFIIGFYFCLVLLDRHREYSLEHAMRWLCD